MQLFLTQFRASHQHKLGCHQNGVVAMLYSCSSAAWATGMLQEFAECMPFNTLIAVKIIMLHDNASTALVGKGCLGLREGLSWFSAVTLFCDGAGVRMFLQKLWSECF